MTSCYVTFCFSTLVLDKAVDCTMALRRQSSDFPVKCKKPKSYDHKITTLDEPMTSAISIIKMMVHIYIQRNVINKQQ